MSLFSLLNEDLLLEILKFVITPDITKVPPKIIRHKKKYNVKRGCSSSDSDSNPDIDDIKCNTKKCEVKNNCSDSDYASDFSSDSSDYFSDKEKRKRKWNGYFSSDCSDYASDEEKRNDCFESESEVFNDIKNIIMVKEFNGLLSKPDVWYSIFIYMFPLIFIGNSIKNNSYIDFTEESIYYYILRFIRMVSIHNKIESIMKRKSENEIKPITMKPFKILPKDVYNTILENAVFFGHRYFLNTVHNGNGNFLLEFKKLLDCMSYMQVRVDYITAYKILFDIWY